MLGSFADADLATLPLGRALLYGGRNRNRNRKREIEKGKGGDREGDRVRGRA